MAPTQPIVILVVVVVLVVLVVLYVQFGELAFSFRHDLPVLSVSRESPRSFSCSLACQQFP